MNYTIYCDGAYSPMRNQGGIGLVYLRDGELIGGYSKKYTNTTNNRMELQCIITILKSFDKPVDSITIVSDSQYVIGTITKNWNRNKNQDLWKLFEDEESRVLNFICKEIKYEWVKGHDENKYNKMADELAVRASQEL